MIRHRRLGPSIASAMAFGLHAIDASDTFRIRIGDERSPFGHIAGNAHLCTSPHHAGGMEALDHSSLS